MEEMSMKKIRNLILIALFILLPFQKIDAQEAEDMSKWSFKILLQHCDQNDAIKIVKFKNKESGRYGFCLEAEVDYNPKDNLYCKETFDDERVFDIVRAFEILGEDYYTAAQLMIWESRLGIRYSFEGKQASDFGEAELLKIMEGFNDSDPLIEDKDIKAKENEEILIDLGDFNKEDLKESTMENLQFEENKLILRPSKEGTIIFEKGKGLKDGAYVYHSDTSQDLYSYEGDYAIRQLMNLHVSLIDDSYSFEFRKVDEDFQPIDGAGFTLYELNENGKQDLVLIKAGLNVDFHSIYPDVDDDSPFEISERYDRYLDGSEIEKGEIGFFPYRIQGDTIHEGLAFICNDEETIQNDIVLCHGDPIAQLQSKGEINVIQGLKPGKKYLLCETAPKKGYTFANDPCIFVDEKIAQNKIGIFINARRTFDLKLYKQNEEHTILLNNARFRISYKENGKEKSYEFVTGALNIPQDKSADHVLYRHENDENIYVGEFKNGSFIKRDARPGTYYYKITDDLNINDSSLLNKTCEVSEGSYRIKDIPYDETVRVEELEAPKGYFIDEAVYSIDADLDYSSLVFRNYRVNRFDIYGNKKQKHIIPKTCIGN